MAIGDPLTEIRLERRYLHLLFIDCLNNHCISPTRNVVNGARGDLRADCVDRERCRRAEQCQRGSKLPTELLEYCWNREAPLVAAGGPQ